jgi:hypothetical protein
VAAFNGWRVKAKNEVDGPAAKTPEHLKRAGKLMELKSRPILVTGLTSTALEVKANWEDHQMN